MSAFCGGVLLDEFREPTENSEMLIYQLYYIISHTTLLKRVHNTVPGSENYFGRGQEKCRDRKKREIDRASLGNVKTRKRGAGGVIKFQE